VIVDDSRFRGAHRHHRASHPRSSEHGANLYQDAFGVSLRALSNACAVGVDEEIASLLRCARRAAAQIGALRYVHDVPVELPSRT
jgi:hypothetical protein